jgi:aspartate 1-decarboxylase
MDTASQKAICLVFLFTRFIDSQVMPVIDLGDGALRSVLRAKIHKATVTQADPDYVGSITIDKNLTEKVGLWANEKVLVASNTSGNRLETYVIEGERGSGKICMNGPAAHLIAAGEEVVIMGFEFTDEPIEPKVILVDKENNFVQYLAEENEH